MIRIIIETDETIDGHDYASMLAWQTADELCGNWCLTGSLTEPSGKVTRYEMSEGGVASGEFTIVLQASK